MAFTFDNDASSIAGILTADPGANVLTISGTQGIVLPSGTIAQRPASPSNGTMRTNTDLGVTEQFVNGTWQPMFQNGGRGFGCVFDDFLMDANVANGALFGEGWTSFLSGAGASVAKNGAQVTSGNDSVGVMEISTGTTTTGQGAMYLSLGCFVLGYGQIYTEWRVMVPVLSGAVDDYDVELGFQDTFNAQPDTNNGAYFIYHSQTTTTWRCKTYAGGVVTITDTGTTVVANTWYKLGILINAAGTSVGFYINDVLLATNTTNIPTLPTGWGIKNYKRLGTTARVVDIDYAQLIYTPTTTR
jgi:hypothetical protein